MVDIGSSVEEQPDAVVGPGTLDDGAVHGRSAVVVLAIRVGA